jgi:tripartite-type tricarboxylate transporter receptor subunit TctC
LTVVIPQECDAQASPYCASGSEMNPSFRIVALPVLALAASLASAQSTSFPSKSVRVVVPFAAGGTTDAAADPIANSPEQFAAFIQAELKKWAKVVQASGARVE